MHTELLKLITNLGLAEKEAKIYLATLELGSEVASRIAKEAGVDRVNTYYMLDTLKKRGLISETEKGGVKYFTAESPEKLLVLGQQTKGMIENNLLNLKNLLPEFLSLYKTGTVRKPRVRFYEGKPGYLNVYDQILEDLPKEVLIILNYKELTKIIDARYEADWIKRRVKLGIKLRWLDWDSEMMWKERAKSTHKLREIKFLPDQYKTSGGIFIYQHKFIFLSTTEDFMAVVVENEEFTALAKMMFELLWKYVAK
ncbi:MAG: Transcriptional regulator, TrmB [Parcubacteria group bacterium LiPW_72]|nr:MAG: Transcriptional regulator, TrmB [Parcubacteria group bacterium LiPW_72]